MLQAILTWTHSHYSFRSLHLSCSASSKRRTTFSFLIISLPACSGSSVLRTRFLGNFFFLFIVFDGVICLKGFPIYFSFRFLIVSFFAINVRISLFIFTVLLEFLLGLHYDGGCRLSFSSLAWLQTVDSCQHGRRHNQTVGK